MKNISLTLVALFVLTAAVFSQSNVKEITFDLKLSHALTTQGGSLNVSEGGSAPAVDNRPIINCPYRYESQQTLFQSERTTQTVYVDVSNLTGNSCVTIVVTTNSGQQKTVIAQKSSTGVLRFDKVKSIILSLELYTNLPTNTDLESKGKASVWF